VERFLSLCAQDNMTVAMPTSPGNYFPPAALACLFRPAQAADRVHPKSMLPLKAAASAVADFTSGSLGRSSSSAEGPVGYSPRGPVLRKVYYDLAAGAGR